MAADTRPEGLTENALQGRIFFNQAAFDDEGLLTFIKAV